MQRTPSPLRFCGLAREGASLGEELSRQTQGGRVKCAAGVGRVRSLAFLSILLGVSCVLDVRPLNFHCQCPTRVPIPEIQ